MRSIVETCVPRPEVLRGELRDELFAASLAQVVTGRAEPVYADAHRFFAETYPTVQLRALVRDVLGRLAGTDPTANAVLLLETPFGGGKTHALIALYHAARGHPAARALADGVPLPERGAVAVAAIVGTDLDPSAGVVHADVTTYTLWGELAYQLGGREAYRLVEDADVASKAAPGRTTLERIVGGRPVLILLDELAHYLVKADAIAVPTGRGTLAEQTVAFLQTLLEFAAARRDAVVVLTMASSTDAFAERTERLREALSVVARNARALTPAEPDEIPAIVVHRLFERVDRAAARETATVYSDMLRQWADHEVALPPSVTTADYTERIVRSYPFHPELIQVLDTRLGTIPNFQRTRGALRLLARVVRRLWSQPRARTWLIHPGDVDLGDPEIVEDLTSRLDRPAFKQVAEADIASRDPRRPAHAEEVDQGYGEERPAQRLATTVFLHSLTQTGTTGIDQPSLLAATLRPGDQPATLERVLEALRERCWFLEVDERGPRYRFTTEPQLAKVIEEERARLSFVQAKEFLCQQIEAIFHRSVLVPVFFPSEPADLPDDAEAPKLAILHFDAAKTSADDDTIPSLVRTLFAQAGQAGLRLYRNAVVFLVADRHEVDAMVERARTFLAIDRLLNSQTVEGSFDERKRNELRRRYDEGRLQVRVAIMRAYRFLYYPHGDASADGVPLHRDILPVQDQGKVERNQTQVVEHRLQTLEKLRRVDDGKGLPAPALVRARAFGIQERLSTAELRRAFFRHTGLPLLTDAVNGVREIVRLGIRAGEWVYYDAGAQQAYDRASEVDPTVRIAEDAFVYTPEAAAREHLPLVRPRPPQPVPTVERCPVCGEPTASCRCGNGITPPRMTEEAIESVGPLSQAIARLCDEMRDRGLTRVRDLALELETGAGNEARAFALWLDRLLVDRGPGLHLVHELRVTLAQGGELEVRFVGPAEQYLRHRSTFDGMLKGASHLSASFRLQLGEFAAGDLERLSPLADDPLAAEFGRVQLTGRGERGEQERAG